MPATIQREKNDTYLLKLSGTLTKSEFSAAQDAVVEDIKSGVKPRVLALLENFDGWEIGEAWGDSEFLYWHSNEIAKIAIVAEPEWEQKALAFAGAGERRASVKVFTPDQQADARAWLEE